MKTKYKLILTIIIILIIFLGILAAFHFKKSKQDEQPQIKVLDKIKGFPYKLKENDSKLQKELFYELEKVLKEKEINYKDYANILAKMFIVDTFSLNNKLNKYDIGGIEFILDSEKEKYKSILSDTLYDSIQNNYDGKRKQELPIVKSIDISDTTESKFLFDNKEILSYDIVLNWTYEKDLGYDDKATVRVGQIDELMYVISYSPID